MMETGLFVRKAQQSDIPAILEIEWECFREEDTGWVLFHWHEKGFE